MKKTKKETKGYPLEPPPILFDPCFSRKEPKFLVELTFQKLSEQKKKREKKNQEVRYLCWGSRELARPSPWSPQSTRQYRVGRQARPKHNGAWFTRPFWPLHQRYPTRTRDQTVRWSRRRRHRLGDGAPVKHHDFNGGVVAAWSGGGGGRRGGKDHWVQKVGGNYPTSPLTMRVRPFIMIMIA